MHSLTLSRWPKTRGANRSLALGLKVRSCGGALRRAKAKGIRDGQQIEKAAAKGTVRPGQFRGEQEKCLGNCPGVSGSISQEDRGTESAAIGKASRYGSSSLKMRPKVWLAGAEASKTSSRGTIATNESSPSPGTFQLSLGPPRPFFKWFYRAATILMQFANKGAQSTRRLQQATAAEAVLGLHPDGRAAVSHYADRFAMNPSR